MPKIAETDYEIERCYAVIAELRPDLEQSEFLPRVRQMASEGYRLAYLEDGPDVVAVAGYRISTNFWLGRHMYVDDLVTAGQARSRGHGEALLQWLCDEARRAGCNTLDLDSGTQRARAHKFYFGQGMTIAGYHFVVPLDI